MNLSEAKQVILRTHLAALRRNHRANGLYLVSGPGVGKSDTVHDTAAALAHDLNQPVGLTVFMLATISSVDVRGFMLPVRSGDKVDSAFSTPPWFPTKANTLVYTPDGKLYLEGEYESDIPSVGILFLDEFGQADDDVKKPAAELIYKGQVGNVRLPQGWRVVAAGNRLADRSGVLRELMFLVNRRCQLAIDASLPAWLEWANKQAPENRPHYLTISFASKNPDLVFRDAVPPGGDPFCTPRTLCLLDKDLRALQSGDDLEHDRLPTDALAREVAAGWIGKGEAAQLFTHFKYADELPDIEDIENSPTKAKLPPKRDAQMVCGYMLAHHLTEKNVAAMMTYIERMHVEMQVLCIRAVLAQGDRAKVLYGTRPLITWLAKNKELLLESQS